MELKLNHECLLTSECKMSFTINKIPLRTCKTRVGAIYKSQGTGCKQVYVGNEIIVQIQSEITIKGWTVIEIN